MQGSLARSLARVPCKVPCIQGGKDKGKKQKVQEAIDLVSGAFFFKAFFKLRAQIFGNATFLLQMRT